MNRFFRAICVVFLATAALACSDGDDPPDAHADATDVRSADDAGADDVTSDARIDTRPEDADDGETVDPVSTLAEGVEIAHIRAYQTVETTLVDSGERVEAEIPLVAGRETLIRVLVDTEAGWSARQLTAQLALGDGTSEPILVEDTRTIEGSSVDSDRTTAFEFRVDGDRVDTQTTMSVRILGDGPMLTTDTTDSGARWPRDGSSTGLEATDSTGTLHLVLVPFRYDRDGSERMPDVGDEQLTIIKDTLHAVYPAADILLEVRQAVPWSGYADFGDINRELRALKQNDGATHAYYYGMIRPDETFADYCSGTCTTGQSFTVSSAEATSYRVGSGVGFSGQRWAWTLVHELGHMHGRGHAPCDVSFWSADGSYPHSDGIIGVRGWDARRDVLIGPSGATDFMGYCDTLWSSDYTYIGILERMRRANQLQEALTLGEKQRWRYLNWGHDDEPTWGRETHETTPYSGEWAHVRFLSEDGTTTAAARVPFVRYAHRGERSVLVPPAPRAAVVARVTTPSRTFDAQISASHARRNSR